MKPQLFFWITLGLFVIVWIALEIRKWRAEPEYNKLYGAIHNEIFCAAMTSGEYDFIEQAIKDLQKLPYKNKERTNLLIQNFRMKYQDEYQRRVKAELMQKVSELWLNCSRKMTNSREHERTDNN